TSKAPITSFSFTPTAADRLNSVVVHTASTLADMNKIYLYKESGSLPGSFDPASDTLLTSAAGATPAADTTLTLTNPLDLAAGTQVKFYVVVDVKSTATLGHTLSFSIAPAKITLDSGNWPPASETA